MGRITPDGSKVLQFRQQRGLSQEALARDARISERLLRDIERRNRPVLEVMLRNLATALSRPLDDLVSRQGSFDWQLLTPPRARDHLLLIPVRDGINLCNWASSSVSFTWHLQVSEIDKEAAALMEEILQLVNRWTNNGLSEALEFDDYSQQEKSDDYDKIHAIPDLFRIARAGEVFSILKEKGISVLSNRYIYCFTRTYSVRSETRDELREEQRMVIGFYPRETSQVVVRINPGVVPPPPKTSWELSEGDLDEEIPF
jgi:transcriptional regulator with XRE-family HTH domain